MKLVKPHKLEKGDSIGIISPASPHAANISSRFERGLQFIEKIGYKVKVGKNARKVHGHKAGTPEERVEDLRKMFEDREVKAIITAIGGYNSNELIDLIDYKLLEQNPKIFCGYSDVTFLHSAIHSRTGLVTFYGPQVMSQFADFGGAIKYTQKYFERLVSDPTPLGRIEPSKNFTFERLEWGREDTRPRKLVPAPGWKVLKEGKAYARLVGGHIGTLLDLAGTKYFPEFKGKIFFWEDTESNTAMTDRYLCHLRMMEIFDKIEGMIVGRTNPYEYHIKDKSYGLHQVILDATEDYDFPIIAEMDFGHTDPMFTIPYGIKAGIDTEKLEFLLLESAVK